VWIRKRLSGNSEEGVNMNEINRKRVYSIILLCILGGFSFKVGIPTAESIAYSIGGMIGNLAGGAVIVCFYASVRRWILKINFPKNFELWDIILYTAIVTAVFRAFPK